MSKNKRILSGVQPSGDLHLGNYLGAIKNFVSLQEEYECFFCVVDLHAITVWQDPSQLAKKTREVTAAFIASGIDPSENILFAQSQVPQHSQLAWIFNCVARMGWLNRMTQFKDKAGSNKEKASVGLYIYPNLMAADILLYKATHVPVGADQKQHLELSRDIAQKFNKDYKCEDFFPLPEPLIQKRMSRVMSLRDGTKKMSKSEESNYSRIDLKDTAEEIVKKIKKAKTDSAPIPDNEKELVNRPEALNLLNIYSDITSNSLSKVLDEMKGKDFSYVKNKLSDALVETICPIGKKIHDLMEDKVYLEGILKKGKEKASIKSEENLKKIREIVGFV